mmetsp:Transcript_20226/g.77632  ORF Transcript_20226/g.77632 Transcript_20226/m.77632 type:complete len:203 (+) Transcript_20226:2474-3082(+)
MKESLFESVDHSGAYLWDLSSGSAGEAPRVPRSAAHVELSGLDPGRMPATAFQRDLAMDGTTMSPSAIPSCCLTRRYTSPPAPVPLHGPVRASSTSMVPLPRAVTAKKMLSGDAMSPAMFAGAVRDLSLWAATFPGAQLPSKAMVQAPDRVAASSALSAMYAIVPAKLLWRSVMFETPKPRPSWRPHPQLDVPSSFLAWWRK